MRYIDDFVVDVVRATGFPSVNLPEYVSHFAEYGYLGQRVCPSGSLALLGRSNSATTSVFTYSSKTLFSISLVKTPYNWDANVSSLSVVVTDLVFTPPSSLETRVG